MESRDNRPLLKFLILGDTSVGKTNILLRYCDSQFTQTHLATLGIDFKLKNTQIDGQKVRMQIWDTAGQERFRTLTKNYYKAAEGIMLVFALNEKSSFESIANWNQQIEENAEQGIAKIMVGNKSDLAEDRQITYQQASNFAKLNNLQYIQTSAKAGVGVEEAFTQLVRKITKSDKRINSKRLDQQKDKVKDKGCCNNS